MDDLLAGLSEAVEALDERSVLALVEGSLEAGATSVAIVAAAEQGMRAVGERYERQEIFLSGLIMAGEIFRRVVERVQPGLEDELEGEATGTVLLGTVAGDIHDIGKNMAALFLRAFGFTVEDLGVNVPAGRFLEAARTLQPDIIGLSGLVSAAYSSMRETVERLRTEAPEVGQRPVIVIGGGTIDEEVAAYIGADHWTTDAMEGVRICQRLMKDRAVRP